jgi:hypothetical protein
METPCKPVKASIENIPISEAKTLALTKRKNNTQKTIRIKIIFKLALLILGDGLKISS